MHASGGPDFFALALCALAAALLLAYLVAAHRAEHDGRGSAMRTASFALGALLILLAMSPPLLTWAHHDLRGHMVQHLLLGMFAPLALALGAPATLLLRSVPAATGRGLVALLGSDPIRVLSHPVTALLLDIGGMYALYLTPLYALTLTEPLAHHFVHLHFLVSGYLFAWAIAGPDPAPHRSGLRTRLIVLLVATAAHASLGKLMYAHGFPRGTPHALEEIRAAAKLMYYGGDLAELLLAVAFFAIWFARRAGRRPDPSIAAPGLC